MIREYKTIREISGPLMVVDHVQGVTYDELAEIVLSDGSTRRCKVLEVNGERAAGRADRATGEGAGRREQLCCCLCRHRHHI